MKKISLLFTLIFLSSFSFAQFGEVKPGTIEIYEPAGIGGLIKPNITFSKIDFPDLQVIGYNNTDASLANLAIFHSGGNRFTKFFRNGYAGLGYGLTDNFDATALGVRYSSTSSNPHIRLINLNNTEPARLNFENIGVGGESWQLNGILNATSTSSFFNFRSSQYGEVLTLRGDGKVGIQTANPTFPLEIDNNSGSVSSTTGAMSIGTVNGTHLVFDSDEINAYSGTAGSTLRLNQESNGLVLVDGTGSQESDFQVNGYSRLGGSGAPNIKTIKLTGTTSSTQGGFATINHSLGAGKILSADVYVEYGTDFFVHQGYRRTAGYEFEYIHTPTAITIYNVATNSSQILSKPIRVLVTYEE